LEFLAVADIDRVLRSNLKLKHLQLLVALDEFRQIGRVAEFLCVTQPAISKTLAEIERTFGVDLFTRSTRGTEPTDNGATIVRFARSVLADYTRACDELAAVASGAAGQTSVGAMVVATPVLLSRAIEALKARSAQTTVSVEEGDLTRLLPRLRVGELDLIVGRLEPGYASPDLETEALYEEPMAIVARPDHAVFDLPRASWADVAASPWIVPPAWASSRVKLNQMFYKHKLNPPVDIVESASFLVTLTSIRERGTLGFVADTVARHFEREGLLRVVPLKVPIELPPVGLIWLAGRKLTTSTQRLVECLRQVAQELQQADGGAARGKAARRPARRAA
jgi:DNA-binding transcriptional LysR family regulator